MIPKKSLQNVKNRGHPELNQGPLDLQSNALPLSYIPFEQRYLKLLYKIDLILFYEKMIFRASAMKTFQNYLRKDPSLESNHLILFSKNVQNLNSRLRDLDDLIDLELCHWSVIDLVALVASVLV